MEKTNTNPSQKKPTFNAMKNTSLYFGMVFSAMRGKELHKNHLYLFFFSIQVSKIFYNPSSRLNYLQHE